MLSYLQCYLVCALLASMLLAPMLPALEQRGRSRVQVLALMALSAALWPLTAVYSLYLAATPGAEGE